MITVDAIAGRRLPVPKGFNGTLIAVATVGDNSVTTSPQQPIFDTKLGYSVTFRERFEFPAAARSTSDAAPGVCVSIRSADDTLNFGETVCDETRKWFSLAPASCGEALCSFAATPAASAPHPLQTSGLAESSIEASPQRRRPATAIGAPVPAWKVVNPSAGEKHHHPEFDWSGLLRVEVRGAKGLSIPASRVTVTPVVQFAMKERRLAEVPTTITALGHVAAVDQVCEFDVPPRTLNSAVFVRVFWSSPGRENQFCGEARFTIALDDCGGTMLTETAEVSGNPRSALTIGYSVAYHRPQREGINGRPLSAHDRVHRHAVVASNGGGDAPHSPSTSTSASAAPPAPSSQLEAHSVCASTAVDGPLRSTAVLDAVEQRIHAAVARAMEQVMLRLTAVEVRVTRSEERLAAMSSSATGGRQVPQTTTSAASGSSGSSGPSSAYGFDVSRSMVTEAQLRERFRELAGDVGHMTMRDLVAFYKASSPLVEDDEAMIAAFMASAGVTGLDAEVVTDRKSVV